eukprot:Rhum_TRINITY_DN11114_c0_g1::Rhum_TRINITY_DN11114_c0_g1_i1::g.42560::m.42560
MSYSRVRSNGTSPSVDTDGPRVLRAVTTSHSPVRNSELVAGGVRDADSLQGGYTMFALHKSTHVCTGRGLPPPPREMVGARLESLVVGGSPRASRAPAAAAPAASAASPSQTLPQTPPLYQPVYASQVVPASPPSAAAVSFGAPPHSPSASSPLQTRSKSPLTSKAVKDNMQKCSHVYTHDAAITRVPSPRDAGVGAPRSAGTGRCVSPPTARPSKIPVNSSPRCVSPPSSRPKGHGHTSPPRSRPPPKSHPRSSLW